jgi:hypothetical protein
MAKDATISLEEQGFADANHSLDPGGLDINSVFAAMGFAMFWLLGASGLWDVWSNRPDHTFQWYGVIWGTPLVVVGQCLSGDDSI